MADVVPASVSEEVVFRQSFIYQSVARPVFTPAPFTYFNMVQGDTGLIFQKTIIYQASVEPFSTETHVFWFEPWSDPTRRKVSVANHPSSVWSNFVVPPEVITLDKWYQWWREPKRFKRGLRADEQQAFIAPPVFPNLIRTIGWFDPLSEPKRFRKGLGVWLQKFFEKDYAPHASPVTFTMSAVEINLDTALFGIFVGEEPVPVGAASASVTVVEIPAISGASASIQET